MKSRINKKIKNCGISQCNRKIFGKCMKNERNEKELKEQVTIENRMFSLT
jgi:hypothetical protein